jgi:hypothetical protein
VWAAIQVPPGIVFRIFKDRTWPKETLVLVRVREKARALGITPWEFLLQALTHLE